MTELAQRLFPMESGKRAVVSLIAAIASVISAVTGVILAIVTL
jgi:hypothetical protein